MAPSTPLPKSVPSTIAVRGADSVFSLCRVVRITLEVVSMRCWSGLLGSGDLDHDSGGLSHPARSAPSDVFPEATDDSGMPTSRFWAVALAAAVSWPFAAPANASPARRGAAVCDDLAEYASALAGSPFPKICSWPVRGRRVAKSRPRR